MGYVRNPFLGSYTLVDKCREGKRQLEAPPRFQIFRPRLVDTQFVCTKIETFKIKEYRKIPRQSPGLIHTRSKGVLGGLICGGHESEKKKGSKRHKTYLRN